jgi:acyl-CoA thioester hydrolase
VTHVQVVPTRWNDNDVYGHLNNTIYYAAMDTVINTWLIREGGFDIEHGDAIGVCVSSNCRYEASGAFPDALSLELSTSRVGTSSVTWHLVIRRESDAEQLATGEFVHVFVGRESRRPVPIPSAIREALQSL